MRVALGTAEVSDEARRAIAEAFGKSGLADRETCRQFLIGKAMSAVDTLAGSTSAVVNPPARRFRHRPEDHTGKCHCGRTATVHVSYGSGCGNVCGIHLRVIERRKGSVTRGPVVVVRAEAAA